MTLLLISIIAPTLSFPSGAPETACQTLTPNTTSHGAQPQATNIPYVLNLSALYDQATDQMVYTPDRVYNSKCVVQQHKKTYTSTTACTLVSMDDLRLYCYS